MYSIALSKKELLILFTLLSGLSNAMEPEKRAVADLREKINKDLISFRKEMLRPVDGISGDFVTLSPSYQAALKQVDEMGLTGEAIKRGRARLENPAFATLFKDLEELAVASNLQGHSSDFRDMAITAMVQLHIATLNSYGLPWQEKLIKAQAERDQERQWKERIQIELNQEKTAHGSAKALYDIHFKFHAEFRAKVDQQNKLIAAKEEEIENTQEALPYLQAHIEGLTQKCATLEDEAKNAEKDLKDLAKRRAESPARRAGEAAKDRQLTMLGSKNALLHKEMDLCDAQIKQNREQLAAQAVRIAKLERDLAASRDAFASCSFTNKP